MPETIKAHDIKVALTGGGTAGHVMPHLALLEDFYARGCQLIYIGSNGMEKNLMSTTGIKYFEIPTGKLRRYISLKNISDIFRIIAGVIKAWLVLHREKPDVVFSKGGFVSVPVAVAAWLQGIPVVSHESDMTPGLANRIISRFAAKIIYAFADSAKFLPVSAELVGLPVRKDILRGDALRGRKMCGFEHARLPILLAMGGSQGAKTINELIARTLPQLCEKFCVIHLTGKGKQLGLQHRNYFSMEFAGAELADLCAASDFVVSRAGATAIFELLVLRRPMLLIPLVVGSRGDQLINAEYFARQGWANVIDERSIDEQKFLIAVDEMIASKDAMRAAQEKYQSGDIAKRIVQIVIDAAKK